MEQHQSGHGAEHVELNERLGIALKKSLHTHLGLRANLRIEHWRRGALLEIDEVHNLLTKAGMAIVSGLLNGALASTNAFDAVAIGTGTNAATADDTQLQTEISTNGGARQDPGTTPATTVARATTDDTNDTATISATFTFTGTFAVTEAGLFNAASGPTMLARQVFSSKGVDSGDSLVFTWKIDCDRTAGGV